MRALGSVSARIREIYREHYEPREPQRYATLIDVFNKISDIVEATHHGSTVVVDHAALAEAVRSYYLDTIRYKDYHFDPDEVGPNLESALAKYGIEDLGSLSPLSPEWSHILHSTVNINGSKAAAYMVKWILRYKPVSVLSLAEEVENKPHSTIVANINEIYALNCALLELGIDSVEVSQQKLDELIYCFRFRSFDEASYFMILTEDYLLDKPRG
ncbi:hypothetical protein RXV86_09795 [Alisedimentitalea sp. MJ-SS2]|uniref:hypothetical protein n=1 Tax=Aliisedimentitalea sp. MJ-SS2 TaxID=3049795 RepID=UPI00290E9010|nr:hypothetical protein [Alisedimentitalea sp. MJ-SS2]MDU8927676.1 hypothetical protein [Alisedimentitalea sp. MJ-SS2]